MSVVKAIRRGRYEFLTVGFKFEKLEVWQLSLEFCDLIYKIAAMLPQEEQYNLKSQMIRSATSISLNIAEGSTGQSNAEFGRFIGMAIRSCIEVVACLQLSKRRSYIGEDIHLGAYEFSEKLFAKLQALRKTLKE